MNDDQVARELRDMTTWVGPAPELWRRAVGVDAPIRAERNPERTRWQIIFSMSVGAAAIVAVCFASYLMITPVTAADSPRSWNGGNVPLAREHDQPEPAQDGRQVVRKATMRLTVDDVHATSVMVRMLVAETRGEYVESADVDARAERPRATILLRVQRTRLEDVLSDIRECGTVVSEHVEAEDVTDQIIDYDVRLANERRIEQELLDLIESRDGDNLDELMLVRQEIDQVRERIERLDAQRVNLTRMVEFAKVAVYISQTPTPHEDPADSGAWSSFGHTLSGAMRSGLDALASTIAVILAMLVGGAPWFVISGVAAVIAWRKLRQTRPLPV